MSWNSRQEADLAALLSELRAQRYSRAKAIARACQLAAEFDISAAEMKQRAALLWNLAPKSKG